MIRLGIRIYRFSQAKRVTVLESATDDIHFNLATEEYLYNTDLTTPTLFLWRNNKTIVIGRHQNPWKECHINRMEKDGVALSRRITGGGAVYHDLGNTCFSFLTPYEHGEEYNYKTVNNNMLIGALKRMGISAEVSGRNDLTHQDKKISGSAYKINLGSAKTGKGKKSLHHGTVLFSVDTNALVNYLNPNKAKLLSKGISSVASRVLNLSSKFPNANHQTFKQSLKQSFIEHYSPEEVQHRVLNYDELKSNPSINQRFQELKSWDWLYGKTPNFTNNLQHRFNWGIIDIHFDVSDGTIQNGVVYSDSLNPDFITALNRILKEQKLTYDFNGVKRLSQLLSNQFQDQDTRSQIKELSEWLVESM